MEKNKTIITDDMVLGYRDYVIDRKTKKDFPTLDSVVEWMSQATLRYAETTKEFYDFAEQEYGIDAIIQKYFERTDLDWPNKDDDENVELIKYGFENRDKAMHASDFTDTVIPQQKEEKSENETSKS